MENFVACLRLGRSLILSCTSPPPLFSISSNSVKRDSFLLWSAVLRTLVCWWIAWRPWSLLRRCHVYASNASLPSPPVLSRSFSFVRVLARSHSDLWMCAARINYTPSSGNGRHPYPYYSQPLLPFSSFLYSSLPNPSRPFYRAARQRVCLCPMQCRI